MTLDRGSWGCRDGSPTARSWIDWASEDELDRADPRVVRRRSDNLLRLTSLSHLRVFRSPDGGSMEWTPGPVLLPASPMEEFGIEDPRIVEIDETYWITYVAVSRHGVATALASTHDFVTFERHGVVFCPENKDVVLFPQKVNGEYFALHRPNPNSHFGPPEIWIARSQNLLHWGQHERLLGGSAEWESDRVGAGTQPVLIGGRLAGNLSRQPTSSSVPVRSARIRRERCCWIATIQLAFCDDLTSRSCSRRRTLSDLASWTTWSFQQP